MIATIDSVKTLAARLRHLVGIICVVLLMFVGSSCKNKSPSVAPEMWKDFDGARAFAHVEKLVGFGARPSGSEALRQTQVYLVDELRKLGLRVEEQTFKAATPLGEKPFNNIIAWLDGGKDIVVLGSHYETKWYTEFEFVGANDGGSSTGALLEITRVLAAHPKALKSTIACVFFDGEEAFVDYSETDGFYGSRYLVREWKRAGLLSRVKAMILMDLMGDKDLTITLPSDSDSFLAREVFRAAEALGTRKHFGLMNGSISDDHTQFALEGIPALNLIDFQYGSRPGLNDYWHTPHDTLDKISPASLRIVGQVLLKMLPTVDAMPSRRQ